MNDNYKSLYTVTKHNHNILAHLAKSVTFYAYFIKDETD